MKSANKKKPRKITLIIDESLLENAMSQTGANLTETVRQGLELVAAQKVYEQIRKQRGQHKIKLSLSDIRAGRE